MENLCVIKIKTSSRVDSVLCAKEKVCEKRKKHFSRADKCRLCLLLHLDAAVLPVTEKRTQITQCLQSRVLKSKNMHDQTLNSKRENTKYLQISWALFILGIE